MTHLARLWTVVGRQPLSDCILMEQTDSEIKDGTQKTRPKPKLITRQLIFPFGFILVRPVWPEYDLFSDGCHFLHSAPRVTVSICTVLHRTPKSFGRVIRKIFS